MAIALVLIGVLASAGAVLSETGPSRDRGVYIGAGAGLGYLNPSDDHAEIKVEEQKDAAAQLLLGLDLGHRLGAELSYTELGTADLSDSATLRYREASLSGLLYGFSSRDNLRQRSGLFAFGRAGIGRLYTQADNVDHSQDNDYHLLLGAGAEYGFSNGLSLRGEYTSYDHDAKYLQLGLIYRFSSVSSEVPVRAVQSAVESPAQPAPAPVADADLDGVGDADDQCPDTVAGLTVNAVGCPVFTADLSGVNFVSDSAELLPTATVILDSVVESLSRYPDVVIEIKAHTDNRGRATYNRDLSQRRAISVARYLSAKGIARSRLVLQAFGESRPIVSNETAEGRHRNRRVEFSTLPQQ